MVQTKINTLNMNLKGQLQRKTYSKLSKISEYESQLFDEAVGETCENDVFSGYQSAEADEEMVADDNRKTNSPGIGTHLAEKNSRQEQSGKFDNCENSIQNLILTGATKKCLTPMPGPLKRLPLFARNMEPADELQEIYGKGPSRRPVKSPRMSSVRYINQVQPENVLLASQLSSQDTAGTLSVSEGTQVQSTTACTVSTGYTNTVTLEEEYTTVTTTENYSADSIEEARDESKTLQAIESPVEVLGTIKQVHSKCAEEADSLLDDVFLGFGQKRFQRVYSSTPTSAPATHIQPPLPDISDVTVNLEIKRMRLADESTPQSKPLSSCPRRNRKCKRSMSQVSTSSPHTDVSAVPDVQSSISTVKKTSPLSAVSKNDGRYSSKNSSVQETRAAFKSGGKFRKTSTPSAACSSPVGSNTNFSLDLSPIRPPVPDSDEPLLPQFSLFVNSDEIRADSSNDVIIQHNIDGLEEFHRETGDFIVKRNQDDLQEIHADSSSDVQHNIDGLKEFHRETGDFIVKHNLDDLQEIRADSSSDVQHNIDEVEEFHRETGDFIIKRNLDDLQEIRAESFNDVNFENGLDNVEEKGAESSSDVIIEHNMNDLKEFCLESLSDVIVKNTADDVEKRPTVSGEDQETGDDQQVPADQSKKEVEICILTVDGWYPTEEPQKITMYRWPKRQMSYEDMVKNTPPDILLELE